MNNGRRPECPGRRLPPLRCRAASSPPPPSSSGRRRLPPADDLDEPLSRTPREEDDEAGLFLLRQLWASAAAHCIIGSFFAFRPNSTER